MQETDGSAYDAIRRLLAHYNINGDRNDVDALATVFSENGVLETSGARFSGRSEIVRGLLERRTRRTAKYVRHHLTTSEIILTGLETAHGRSYWLVITDVGIDRSGTYDDMYRKIDGEWKIERRIVTVDYCAPETKMIPLSRQ